MLSALCAPLRAAQADTLSLRQQSIVAIAASAATGALEHLRTALARGLDGGMTVNETKEVMVHAYAYCGFPAACVVCSPLPCRCSTSAKRGASPTLWGATRRPSATAATTHPRRGAARKAERRPRRCAQDGLCRLCPPIVDRYLNEHLFCDIFERDLLTWQERELAAVAILTALGEGAPADAAVALRHLPAPGAHGRPAPPDDGNRKRAERRRRPPLHAAC